jgi:hypothetical protein
MHQTALLLRLQFGKLARAEGPTRTQQSRKTTNNAERVGRPNLLLVIGHTVRHTHLTGANMEEKPLTTFHKCKIFIKTPENTLFLLFYAVFSSQ